MYLYRVREKKREKGRKRQRQRESTKRGRETEWKKQRKINKTKPDWEINKTGKLLTRKKKEHRYIANINQSRKLTIDATDNKRIIKRNYEELYPILHLYEC
mgnify:CR=1 FL=1